jgi:hypothetical protein
MTNIYYVYQYLREDSTPYYIGKGKGNRIYEKHNVSIPTDKSRIIKIAENLTENQAFNLEIELIAKYGRKDLGTGILRNLSSGGDGNSGWVPTNETREKIRLGNKGKKRNEETRKKMSSSKQNMSKETKCKMSISHIGKKLPIEQREKIGNAHRGKIVTKETCEKISASRIGEKNPNYGKSMSGKNNPFYGKKHSPETIAKIKEAAQRRKLKNKV